MVRAGWGRRLSMATMGVAAALVLAVGGVGTVRVAADLLSESGEDGGALLSVSGPAGAPGPDSFAAFDTGDEALALEAMYTAAAQPALAAVPTGTPRPAPPEPGWTLTTLDARVERTAVEAQDFADARQIVSQASLTIEVRNVNAATIQLRGLVESAGGFIEHISTSGGPNPEFGSAVVRVPGERFVDTLDRIEGLGRPLEQSLGQRDVTGQAIDLEARLRSERGAGAEPAEAARPGRLRHGRAHCGAGARARAGDGRALAG